MKLPVAVNKRPPSDGQFDGDRKVTVHFPLIFSFLLEKAFLHHENGFANLAYDHFPASAAGG